MYQSWEDSTLLLSPLLAWSLFGLWVKPAKRASAPEILCLWKPVTEPQQHVSSWICSGQAVCERLLQAVLKTVWSNYGHHPGCRSQQLFLGMYLFCRHLIPPTVTPETWQCVFLCITAAAVSLLGESSTWLEQWLRAALRAGGQKLLFQPWQLGLKTCLIWWTLSYLLLKLPALSTHKKHQSGIPKHVASKRGNY